MPASMIQARGLAIGFNGRAVFCDVNLEVVEGESAVVIGPSGGGKSVLLKVLCGLLTPDAGTVELGSDDLGMLFQRNALFDSMTCEENLTFPLAERKGIVGSEARDRAGRMLAAVGLAGNERLFPDEISGGMQKRLGIARALIVEPRILLYDEPTAGLDPVTSRIIAALMLEVSGRAGGARGRTTLLTVTNDMQRAYQIADRIYFMARGGLREGGSPAAVQGTADPELRQFIYGLAQGPLTAARV